VAVGKEVSTWSTEDWVPVNPSVHLTMHDIVASVSVS